MKNVNQVQLKKKEDYFFKYGNRTNSLISIYPHFKSMLLKDKGVVNYTETKSAHIIASEPLVNIHERKNVILDFFKHKNSKRKVIFPISRRLSQELENSGFYVWQIGVEPIFLLNEYFNREQDIMSYFPLARALRKRGGEVLELSLKEVDDIREQIKDIQEEWLLNKKGQELDFLNRVEPFLFEDHKRYFILKDKGVLVAFLTASPIYYNEQILGYYFNDIIKRAVTRAGVNELLILETMKKLYREGILEVRLGMCPLAEINSYERDSEKLTKIFKRWKFGYNFSSLYNFKKKLMPTKMEPLYYASTSAKLSDLFWDILHANFKKGIFSAAFETLKRSSLKSLELESGVKKLSKNTFLNTSLKGILFNTKVTTTLFLSFILLDFAKNQTTLGKDLFNHSAYLPSAPNLLGLFLGPLFHNHALHLFGDQITFLFFGGIVEFLFGPLVMLTLFILGLWVSNPVTHLLLSFTVPSQSPEWWQSMLQEKDYGTSNGVFALVGAAIYFFKRKLWLMLPFFTHAVYIIFQRESILAFHHVLAMYMGFICFGYFSQKKFNQL